MNRRNFLKNIMASSVAMSLPMTNLLANTGTTSEDFKAIVCLFLSGGNDSINMLVPYEDTTYADYQSIRPALALDKEELVPLIGPDGEPSGYALHPKLPKLAQLYQSGELAFLSNVGPLVEPTTLEGIENQSVKTPPYLFSHNSQRDTWNSCYTDSRKKTGWAGRIADDFITPDSQFVMNQSIDSLNMWQKGASTSPYIFGSESIDLFRAFEVVDTASTRELVEELSQFDYANPLVKTYNRIHANTINNGEYAAGVLGTDDEPNDDLNLAVSAEEFDGYHLADRRDLMDRFRMLAKLIVSRDQFSRNRATYYLEDDGYDTHSGQTPILKYSYEAIDDSISAFYTNMKKHGLENKVTLFLASDFGRTVTTNSTGTDHGWGGHYFVLGGDVQGGQVYGQQPVLQHGSPDIYLKNRLIPTTSVDQYAATITRWFGLSDEQNLELFPNLKNFPVRDLGFMKT